MAILKNGRCITIDAPGTEIIVTAQTPAGRTLADIDDIVITPAAAAATLKIYAAQSAVAANLIFQATAPIGISINFRIAPSIEQAAEISREGLFVDLTGAGAVAFIYLR